jgi:hypothetical protein
MSGAYVSTPPIRLHDIYSDITLQTIGKTMASSVPPAVVGFLDSVQVSKHKGLSLAEFNTWLSVPTFL